MNAQKMKKQGHKVEEEYRNIRAEDSNPGKGMYCDV
jgi:hypothetical protein